MSATVGWQRLDGFPERTGHGDGSIAGQCGAVLRALNHP